MITLCVIIAFVWFLRSIFRGLDLWFCLAYLTGYYNCTIFEAYAVYKLKRHKFRKSVGLTVGREPKIPRGFNRSEIHN